MARKFTACLASLVLLGWPAATVAAALKVELRDRDGKPFAGAIVTLHADGGVLPAAMPVHTTVDQIKMAFVPDLLVIPVGSSVEFPNSDAVSHQVYSFSSARRFQLPLYRGKAHPPVQFDKPGLVALGCNIHDNMLAYLLVTDAPLFGRTNERGEWTAPNVPAGRYRATAWHPRINDEPATLEREVSVADADGEVSLKLTSALRPAAIGGRPRSWDAY